MVLKKEITGQLKLSELRDNLLNCTLTFLISSQDFFLDEACRKQNLEVVVRSLNKVRLEEVLEERLAMGYCANVYCHKKIPDDVKSKAKK